MPGRGIKQLREDVSGLPPRYRCRIDRETPEHCTAEIDGVRFGIWMDDVSLYPARHVAQVFPIEDSQRSQDGPCQFPPMLQSLQLSGEISEMLLMISDVITSSPATGDLDSVMTEAGEESGGDDDEYENVSDGDTWEYDWTTRRSALVKQNCEKAQNSDLELLQDTGYIDENLESLVWTRIPIADIMDAGLFSQMEADTWGLSKARTLWIVFHIDKSDEDYNFYLRQAEHDIRPRDIIKNLIRKTQVLCVLESYVRKTVLRLLENTVEYTGKLVLERFPDISKYCSICGEKSVDIPSVKPFCCSNHLCQFQFMYVDLNGELEDILLLEPDVVDLLIQLAYVAAWHNNLSPYPDCLSGDDAKSVKNSTEICELLNILPSVDELAKLAAVTNGLSRLKRIDPRLLPLLRWIVMSNTAHISRLEKQEQMIVGLGKSWHQFKMMISTPEKEHIFQQHKSAFGGKSIFAFHGSPLSNWHSILRTGLHFKKIVHGRSYGDGIYHAFEIGTSMGYCGYFGGQYNPHSAAAGPPPTIWTKAAMEVTMMISVNEIVLDESSHVRQTPFLVVNDVEKVQTRYLIIQGYRYTPVIPKTGIGGPPKKPEMERTMVECPAYPSARIASVAYNEPPNKFNIYGSEGIVPARADKQEKNPSTVWVPEDGFSISCSPAEERKTNVPLTQLELPHYASPASTKHLHQELRALLKAQTDGNAIFKLDRSRLDNLYSWTVYLTNFSPELPLAQDLQRLSLKHVEICIVFGDKTPLNPPFVRVVQPRFVAFSQGGGGHVTAGGSICTSFLTMEDWSPVYSISQVLIMVHSALSSVDPRPARIADKGCYNEREAREAYVRVAETHGWRIPEGFNHLFIKEKETVNPRKSLPN